MSEKEVKETGDLKFVIHTLKNYKQRR